MHKRKALFTNPYVKDIHRNIKSVFLWKSGYYDHEKLESCALFGYPVYQKQASLSNPFVTWVNHSTFLIEIDGVRVLTDPIWGKRCSPLFF